MHHSISIPAAAELCDVGEPAVRRAFREGRITLAFQWVVGGGGTTSYLNLDSVVRCYGVDHEKASNLLKKWVKFAPVARTPDGREWLILDRAPPMILMEPAEHGSSSDD